MSAITRPPPPGILKTYGRKPNNYYTLHSGINNAFTLNIGERERSCVIGFKTVEDANLIGRMIDTYYAKTLEWPEFWTEGALVLPKPETELVHIFIHQWDFEDLKLMCTRNILDMISVEEIITQKQGYSFSGNMYTFDAPSDFYRERFEEFLN